ncbi:MAG: Methyltransferase domain protein [candidate division CPR2 bacterium GW2011_GWC1_39_9]|uniref:Methyltransferase domain protein n=1 Tax=candidate division CPR2 bacterium GW2011_GWC2_39_10 TaxID=1618345 RepID=A0A0G0PUC8_UNCC2|nr:MAG: Methyltransferase domain protein [candidate division CPR2 bacterium GW2011_GWC2_39_10]KKR32706.1 MAG: Methyltransferase domain protein [candidate division CPR2 bacterium GW2011_GWC1_39_9]
MSKKFDFSKIERLESPQRKKLLPAEDILRQYGLTEGMRVVDFGSGSGYFTFPAAKIVGSKGFVCGIDIDPEFVNYAKNRAKKENVKNVDFLTGDESSITVDSGSIDYILAGMTLHELKDIKKFFKEAKRVLKVDGRLLIIEWQKRETPMGPPVSHRLSAAEISKAIENTGFKIRQEKEINNMHYLLEIEKT